MNANPSYLSNCARDMACTKVTCQGSGVLSGRIDSAAITLLPCKMPAPGITVSLVQGGTTVVSRMITGHMTITYDAGIATVNVEVFINSTTDSVGILVSFELLLYMIVVYIYIDYRATTCICSIIYGLYNNYFLIGEL